MIFMFCRHIWYFLSFVRAGTRVCELSWVIISMNVKWNFERMLNGSVVVVSDTPQTYKFTFANVYSMEAEKTQ